MSARNWYRTLALVVMTGAWLTSPALAGNGSWTTSGPNGKSIKEILGHPTNPNILYGGAFGLGVFKSTDNGLTWREHRSGFRNSFVRSLAMDVARPETLYAGTNDGLYRSLNGDSTWTLLFDASALATPTSVRAVTLDRSRPGTIYLGTFDDGIFKSVDYGAHWTAINLGLTNTSIRCVTVNPAHPDTVLAGTGTGGGVFVSGDGGLFWTQVSDTAATTSAAEKIVYDPLRPTRIYVATGSHGVVVSQDGGSTWGRQALGLTSFATRSLAIIDTVRFVGTDTSGVFYSTLRDPIWRPVLNGLSNLGADALFARSRTDVWVGTDGGGLFHTLNAGALWTQVDGGLLRTDIFALGVSPNSARVYSGTGFGDQFWISANQGGQWTRTPGLPGIHGSIEGIANEAGSVATVYAAITGLGVYRSTDYGTSWLNPDLGGTLQQGLGALASHPVRPGVLYAGATAGVYKTVNGGTDWTFASSGLPGKAHVKSLALHPLTPDTVFAGTDSLGLFVSINGGASWAAVGPGLPSPYVRDVACDPRTPGVVYAATEAGLYRSANNGATWSPRNTGLPALPSVRAITYDRAYPNTWFTAVWQAGVYRSVDSGTNWTAMLSGLGSINVAALTVDALNRTVYAGTQAGTYQYSNYPVANVGVESGFPGALSLRASPNPFGSSVEITFVAAAGSRVRLEVFDLAGRRVRNLVDRTWPRSESASIAWDGRDDRGSALPAGVYLARLNGAGSPRFLRLARVR